MFKNVGTFHFAHPTAEQDYNLVQFIAPNFLIKYFLEGAKNQKVGG